ncbi:MAG: ThiF family adenylyltransferase [Bacteroidota bacterium]
MEEKSAQHPIVFRMNITVEKERLNELIQSQPALVQCNNIDVQLADWVKLNHPKEYSKNRDLTPYIEAFEREHPLKSYGCWVYYPWKNTVVRTLSPEHFVEVRTARNKHKITVEEQEELSRKRIGVVGLSVGNSIALTLALERIFGTLRIADFDELELSNMNRIFAGIDQLGMPKTTIVSRSIAELDPFLSVEPFNAGVTTANIASFFEDEEHNPLDVIIDECDSIAVKIALREEARKRKIPLIMQTSDRGLIDIERYDLEPEAPLFHGLLSTHEIEEIKMGTEGEALIAAVQKIIDPKTMSEGLKKSLAEIGKSITTWPQLGSDVTFGGAVTAQITRDILLNKSDISGRHFLEIDTAKNDRL